MSRSAQRDVRNPLLALPAAQRLLELSPDMRDLIADLMKDLSVDANERAQQSWRKSKGPMAAYWKAVSVYAKHVRKVLKSAP